MTVNKRRTGNKQDREPDQATPDGKLSERDYQRELTKLHGELVALQLSTVQTGLRVCIIFEGRDGAGKGGVIKAITERVSPRVFRVVALPAPTEREKSQMYMQRYVQYLPAAGEIVIFDRSWYIARASSASWNSVRWTRPGDFSRSRRRWRRPSSSLGSP